MIRRAFLARMAYVAITLGVVRYEIPEIAPWQPLSRAWVSNQGSDVFGDGSAAAPFETLAHAIDRIGRGGTVYVVAGEYEAPRRIFGEGVTLHGLGGASFVVPE